MNNRIPANSEGLKKAFKEIYEDFFSSASLIVSAPTSFFWAGENTTVEGGAIVSQRLPLRVYVALSPARKREEMFDSYSYYSRFENQFIESSFDDTAILYKLNTFLKEYLNLKSQNIKITFLSEVRIGTGLSTTASLACALASALLIWTGKITAHDIQNWKNYPVSKLISERKLKFDLVYKLATKIRSIFHYDNVSSGATVFASQLSSALPNVYFSQVQNRKKWLKYWQTRFSHIDNLIYWGGKITDLFPSDEVPLWPIDFGIISVESGEGILSVYKSTSLLRDKLEPLIPYLRKRAKDLPTNVRKIFPFYDLYSQKEPTSKLYQYYLNPMISESLITLFALEDLFVKGLNERTVNSLCESINAYHKISSAIGLSSPQLDSLCNIIYQLRKNLDGYITGAKSLSGVSLSEVLFVFPHRILRNKVDLILEEISKNLNSRVVLDYASWIDGFESKGIKVEQHLTDKIYSRFVSAGSVQVKEIPADNLIVSHLYTRDHFTKEKNNMDLVLDEIEEKIYIRGKTIHSKDIPSSKTTIRVLKILFEKVGKEVANSQFGTGSYFQDRNEFQSKIVSPLNKTVEKLLGKHLNISVSGNLLDFRVKLSPSPFDIYLVERDF